jgi:RNA polymerase sigma-70 factor (ECF subfamily)
MNGTILHLKRAPKGDLLLLDEERELIEQAKQNPQAFGRLFDRYHDEIFNYILHRTANVELAKDLTAETFYRVLQKLWTFRWRNVRFSAWLTRVASNEVNGYFRKYKNFKTLPLEESDNRMNKISQENSHEMEQASKEMREFLLFESLHQAISLLKVKYQEVITLRFFENKKVKEISEILNKPEGTVKSLIHRALGQLNRRLDSSSFKGER